MAELKPSTISIALDQVCRQPTRLCRIATLEALHETQGLLNFQQRRRTAIMSFLNFNIVRRQSRHCSDLSRRQTSEPRNLKMMPLAQKRQLQTHNYASNCCKQLLHSFFHLLELHYAFLLHKVMLRPMQRQAQLAYPPLHLLLLTLLLQNFQCSLRLFLPKPLVTLRLLQACHRLSLLSHLLLEALILE